MSSMRATMSKRARAVAGATAISLGGFAVAGFGAWRPAAAYGAGLSPRAFALTCDVEVSDDTQLRAAVAGSVDDSVICIAQSITLSAQLAFVNTSVTLVGRDDSEVTLFAPPDDRHIYADFRDGGDDTLVIESLNLFGGRTALVGGSIYLGGLPTDSLVTRDSKFVDNQAHGVGGGAIFSTSKVTTVKTDFVNNKATGRAGAGDGGAINARAPLHIEGGLFDSNSADFATNGGGAIFAQAEVSVKDATFAANVTSQAGGGIWANGPVSVSTSSFDLNRSSGVQGGGAIWTSGTVSTNRTTFDNHQATGGPGGAIRSGQHVTTTDDTFFSNASWENGGAIRADDTVATSNSRFTSNNAAFGNGGAIFADDTVVADKGSFHNNLGITGGAIYSLASSRIIDVSFSENTASSQGGAVWVLLGQVYVHGGEFLNNNVVGIGASNVGYGGAIYAGNGAVLIESIVRGNSAPTSGGAVHTSNNSVAVTRSTVSDNDSRVGGAIYSELDVESSMTTFANNSAEVEGGAIFSLADVKAENTTFSANLAKGDGAAVFAPGIHLDFVTSVDDSSAAGSVFWSLAPPGELTISGSVISPEVGGGTACNTSADDSSYDSFVTDSSCGSGDDTVTITTRALLGFDDTLVTDDSTGAMVLIPDDTSILVNAAPANLVLGVTRDQLQATRGRPPGEGSTTVGAVQVLPVLFTTQPANASVTAGGAATFTVAADPGVGTSPVTFQWQTSSDGGATWANASGPGISGATTGTLTVASASAAQNGLLVRAVASDLRPAAANSATATLTVQTPTPGPGPVPATPPGAPCDPVASAGNAQASVAWQAPSSPGTSPITRYEVTNDIDATICQLVVAPSTPLTCTVSNLTNGTAYRFRVRALNDAGWGSWSDWSATVTPTAPPDPPDPPDPPGPPSILVTGMRDGTTARVTGTATHLTSEQVRTRVRLQGQKGYRDGVPRRVTSAGTFTWQRTTSKKVYVYFTADGIRSNRVIIPSRR